MTGGVPDEDDEDDEADNEEDGAADVADPADDEGARDVALMALEEGAGPDEDPATLLERVEEGAALLPCALDPGLELACVPDDDGDALDAAEPLLEELVVPSESPV